MAWKAFSVQRTKLTSVLKLALRVQIKAEEGLKGFYRGCTTNLLRTTPAAALTFTSFEMLSREMKKMGAKQRESTEEESDAAGSLRTDSSRAMSARLAGMEVKMRTSAKSGYSSDRSERLMSPVSSAGMSSNGSFHSAERRLIFSHEGHSHECTVSAQVSDVLCSRF